MKALEGYGALPVAYLEPNASVTYTETQYTIASTDANAWYLNMFVTISGTTVGVATGNSANLGGVIKAIGKVNADGSVHWGEPSIPASKSNTYYVSIVRDSTAVFKMACAGTPTVGTAYDIAGNSTGDTKFGSKCYLDSSDTSVGQLTVNKIITPTDIAQTSSTYTEVQVQYASTIYA